MLTTLGALHTIAVLFTIYILSHTTFLHARRHEAAAFSWEAGGTAGQGEDDGCVALAASVTAVRVNASNGTV